MRYLILNGDRQDAFWQLAVQSAGMTVDATLPMGDPRADAVGWHLQALPCVAEIEGGKAVYQAITLADVQNYAANLQAARDAIAAQQAAQQQAQQAG